MANNLETRGMAASVPVVFCLTVLAGGTVAVSDPNPLIEQGYGAALAASYAPQSGAQGAPAPGSEAYWLSQGYGSPAGAVQIEPVSWTAPVAKGEQIVVGTGDQARTLAVVAVDLVPETTTRIDSAFSGARFLVSCRDPADPDGRLIRVVVEAASPAAVEPQSL